MDPISSPPARRASPAALEPRRVGQRQAVLSVLAGGAVAPTTPLLPRPQPAKPLPPQPIISRYHPRRRWPWIVVSCLVALGGSFLLAIYQLPLRSAALLVVAAKLPLPAGTVNGQTITLAELERWHRAAPPQSLRSSFAALVDAALIHEALGGGAAATPAAERRQLAFRLIGDQDVYHAQWATARVLARTSGTSGLEDAGWVTVAELDPAVADAVAGAIPGRRALQPVATERGLLVFMISERQFGDDGQPAWHLWQTLIPIDALEQFLAGARRGAEIRYYLTD